MWHDRHSAAVTRFLARQPRPSLKAQDPNNKDARRSVFLSVSEGARPDPRIGAGDRPSAFDKGPLVGGRTENYCRIDRRDGGFPRSGALRVLRSLRAGFPLSDRPGRASRQLGAFPIEPSV